ncbi:clathrin light chain-like isoform X2 [Amphibalanus amphitrite]|uniref:clathrin light chain-like isoform X2 n=1 Tax=Amphibalanus amphitrite TaxID=1232801 RepID=UPI001C92646D|nr:clathrin light chain-like isoform X2 [Amphibalanus amphitrite]XP_043242824.1 clathrin light chain-like isoform X2 [Amphibalanus amphitrite]
MDFDSSTDPAAEFLAREQDQLAGIGDDIITGTEPAAAPADEETLDAGASPDNQGFEILGTEGRGDAGFDPISAAAPSPTPVPRIEPEKIRRWREEQKARLEEKDEEEERKKAEWREAAKKELEDWYKQHEESVSKTRAANRAAEKELVSGEAKSTERAADWEQIAKLCEFNPKVSRNTKDTSRMRSLILQLKQNPPVKSG